MPFSCPLSFFPLFYSSPALYSTTAEAAGLRLHGPPCPNSQLCTGNILTPVLTTYTPIFLHRTRKPGYFKGRSYKESHPPSSGERHNLKLHNLLPQWLGQVGVSAGDESRKSRPVLQETPDLSLAQDASVVLSLSCQHCASPSPEDEPLPCTVP